MNPLYAAGSAQPQPASFTYATPRTFSEVDHVSATETGPMEPAMLLIRSSNPIYEGEPDNPTYQEGPSVTVTSTATDSVVDQTVTYEPLLEQNNPLYG